MSVYRPVMFDRPLRPEWVDHTLEQYMHSPSERALRILLREWLNTKGMGAYTAQKTALQLQRIAGFRSSLDRETLSKYHKAMSALAPDDRRSLRMELMLSTCPFFKDCVGVIQRMLLNGAQAVQMRDLYARVQDIYGYRGTIPRRVRSVMQTLAQFGYMEKTPKGWKPTDWFQEL